MCKYRIRKNVEISRAKFNLKGIGTQTGVQALGGGTGEFLAQVASGDEISPAYFSKFFFFSFILMQMYFIIRENQLNDLLDPLVP